MKKLCMIAMAGLLAVCFCGCGTKMDESDPEPVEGLTVEVPEDDGGSTGSDTK